MSSEIAQMLTKEMKDRTICLMLDTCTKGPLSVLSINAQYMINDEIITRSLGVFQLNHRHTAHAMATTVRDYLQNTFKVSMRQVKAIVTDNAKNMILTRKLLNKLALGETITEYEDVSEDESDICDNEDDEEGARPSSEDEMELANIMNNNDEYEELVSNIANEFARYYGSILAINPISCSTHTIQLAIKDSFIVTGVNTIINKVNDLCKLMRSQLVLIALGQRRIKIIKPPLKNVTRWNSDYLMVNSPPLLNTKIFTSLVLTYQFVVKIDYLHFIF